MQKEIQELLEKDIFKVIMPEKIPSRIQVFNSSLVDNIKNLYTDKAYKKNRPVVHIYNNKKKNFVLIHLSKILEVNQDIGSCLADIIQDNDNNNIRFYLWNIK